MKVQFYQKKKTKNNLKETHKAFRSKYSPKFFHHTFTHSKLLEFERFGRFRKLSPIHSLPHAFSLSLKTTLRSLPLFLHLLHHLFALLLPVERRLSAAIWAERLHTTTTTATKTRLLPRCSSTSCFEQFATSGCSSCSARARTPERPNRAAVVVAAAAVGRTVRTRSTTCVWLCVSGCVHPHPVRLSRPVLSL